MWNNFWEPYLPTLIEKVLLISVPFASVTLSVKVKYPVLVGVPVTVALDPLVLSVRPAGRVPLAKSQV